MWNNLKFLLPFLIIGFSFSCRTIKPVNGGAPIKILNTKKLMDSIHHHEPKMNWANRPRNRARTFPLRGNVCSLAG